MQPANSISNDRKHIRSGGGLTTSAFSVLGKVLSKVPVGSVVNSVIDAIPVELHIPGYQYCGAGTKLAKRLARGDLGINKLDQACKAHDIAYSIYSDTPNRSVADSILAHQAWKRVKSSDASLGERAAALTVAAAMKAKSAVGSGYKKKKNGQKKGKQKVKSGGNINQRKKTQRKQKKTQRKSKKKNYMQGDWTMLKSGKGLYLRPYRNA